MFNNITVFNSFTSTKMTKVGDKLSYHPQKKIGRGAFSAVFEGLFEGRTVVAVKRFQKSDIDNEVVFRREADLMMKAEKPPKYSSLSMH